MGGGQTLVVGPLKTHFFMCVFTKLFIIFRLKFPSVQYTGYKRKIKKPTLNLNWIYLKIVIFLKILFQKHVIFRVWLSYRKENL